MRFERARKKKLLVAFHFQFANRAGWDCGSCRQHGLEEKRRCGFLPRRVWRTTCYPTGRRTIIWGRKRVETEECPKSLITGESVALLEEFFVRRRLGMVDSPDMAARKVDAFLILRDEMEREERDGKTEH